MDVHPPWTDKPAGEAAALVEPAQAAEQPTSVAVPEDGVHPGRNVFKVGSTVWDIPDHLQFLKSIGSGTYGSVAALHDSVADTGVAIKMIGHPFRNAIDGKRCLREIKLLRLLEHDCIIQLLDVLPPPSPDFRQVYIVTELMDADLHTVISSEQPLSDDHVQFFVYHILRALLYIHSANVVHRDLKPLNVLVNKNCDIKLCDFGLARGRAGFSQEDDDFLRTEYVGTRWYRAPEIVLTSMEYTAAVDIWSVGCILGELIGRVPMFRGSDFLDQIRSICEVLGTPSDDDLSFVPPENKAARNFIKTRFPSLPRKGWTAMYPQATEATCKLLDGMLRFDPNGRLTASEALRHPYLEGHYDEEDEIVAPGHIDWSFDDVPQEPGRLQNLVYLEAAALHPDILERDREELEARGWTSNAMG
jgi:mitogen-activated protein kinase 1/3